MKRKEEIVEQQKAFVQHLKERTAQFIGGIDTSEIESILLSGSLSRGDFFPRKKADGEYGTEALQGRSRG
ncbi:MAG: hypothetical protein II932_07745 [Treponema sp.]|nr:hypothetical protein [Treponema sp.]